MFIHHDNKGEKFSGTEAMNRQVFSQMQSRKIDDPEDGSGPIIEFEVIRSRDVKPPMKTVKILHDKEDDAETVQTIKFEEIGGEVGSRGKKVKLSPEQMNGLKLIKEMATNETVSIDELVPRAVDREIWGNTTKNNRQKLINLCQRGIEYVVYDPDQKTVRYAVVLKGEGDSNWENK